MDDHNCEIPWERVSYLSALDVWSRQGAIYKSTLILPYLSLVSTGPRNGVPVYSHHRLHTSIDISIIRDTQRPWSFVQDLRPMKFVDDEEEEEEDDDDDDDDTYKLTRSLASERSSSVYRLNAQQPSSYSTVWCDEQLVHVADAHTQLLLLLLKLNVTSLLRCPLASGTYHRRHSAVRYFRTRREGVLTVLLNLCLLG